MPELTFFPTISTISDEEQPHFSNDEYEDGHSPTREFTLTASFDTEQSQPEKFKPITQLYEETSPITPNLEDCMISVEEPLTYAEAS